MNKVVFVAVSSKFALKEGTSVLSENFVRQMAKLHEQYPYITFVSPMLQDVQLLPYLPLDTKADWYTWKSRCEGLVAVCHELWVLNTMGWQDSIGVIGERNFAATHGIPVKIVDPL